MKLEVNKYQKSLNLLFEQFITHSKAWTLLPINFYEQPWHELNLSCKNSQIAELGLKDSMHPLGSYINNLLASSNSIIGYGGWQEDRSLYQASHHFDQGTNSRSIHLGVDLWFKAGTPILCPYPAKIHSFKNNANFLDYGPTIILEHNISKDFTFFSLYGHLSCDSLTDKYIGKEFDAGEVLATLGSPPENGDWPPHLHFQIILDLLGNNGDFPGVSSREDQDFYRCICPDPVSLLFIAQ